METTIVYWGYIGIMDKVDHLRLFAEAEDDMDLVPWPCKAERCLVGSSFSCRRLELGFGAR